jgi:TM2 domain-containing membrane protein YozV
MGRKRIAALLSALVFPGAGQIYNREAVKGTGLIVVTIGLIVGLVLAVLRSFYRAAELYDGYGSIWTLWGAELGRSRGLITMCIVGLFVAWIFSIVDAYLRGGTGR